MATSNDEWLLWRDWGTQMTVPGSERDLGDMWADVMRARGCWVQKLPALIPGISDWLMVRPGEGICLVEAKKLQPSGSAFVPSQCTRAQRFWLETVARYGGSSYVLVLGLERWCMWQITHAWPRVEVIPRRYFDETSKPYLGGAA